MSIAIDPHSRFKLSQPVVINGIETFGLLTKFPFLDPASIDDADIVKITVTPDMAGKPWAIANAIYNSPVLDWVIVLFNRPLNPVNWPPNGTVIRAPRQGLVLPLV